MALTRPGAGDLEPVELPVPTPGPEDVVIRVLACGVCRTDLHVVDGELPDPIVPLVPGHEIVGRVVAIGRNVEGFGIGSRVGVPWLAHTCGGCEFCRGGRENLCPDGRYTGYQVNGGYAEYAAANAAYCFHIPEGYDDLHAAPLLCAGLIGYRAYRMAGPGRHLGLYGFGAAAHVITQVAVKQSREVFAFTAPGDDAAMSLARDVGAVWSGPSNLAPPIALDCAIVFAPVGALVPEALSRTRPGGVVVCAGIHMSDIPGFPYRLLWHERTIRSVANLTRADGHEFLATAATIPINTRVHGYALADANQALRDLREGRVSGAAVIVP
jgi:propanol-preferring alcohol dehydrogenase